jgi:hypothetical protein
MIRHLFSNLVSSWFTGLRRSYRRIPPRQTGCRPPRHVHLMLEQLEARVVPTSAAVAPPSFTQAAISLYEDGFQLGYNPFNLLSGAATSDALHADIASNTPYAQPFAALFVMAGEIAGRTALDNVNLAISHDPHNQAANAAMINSL